MAYLSLAEQPFLCTASNQSFLTCEPESHFALTAALTVYSVGVSGADSLFTQLLQVTHHTTVVVYYIHDWWGIPQSTNHDVCQMARVLW